MKRIRLPLVFVTLLSLCATTSNRAEGAPSNGKPTWPIIAHVYDAYFAKLPGHHPDVLITQTDVTDLWQALTKAKWNVPQADRDYLTKLIPKDGEFFVKQLHTSKGRAFMRNVAIGYPDIYDRLDLLSRMPGGGKPAVSGLIAAPDAQLTVKYMFSKSGAQSWASLLGDDKSFNKPTGRIYTAELLKSRLQQLYDATNTNPKR